MKKIIAIILALLLHASGPECFGQNATVLLDSTYVKCSSVLSMTSRHHKKILVLNKAGAGYANFVCTTNKIRTLKDFKCTVYGTGNGKRSFAKKDLISTELSENMADDYTTHYLEITYPSFPYIVEMEYLLEYTNGYISMPSFAPAYYVDVAVEKAVYHLQTPESMGYSYKAVNTDAVPEIRTEKGARHAIWRLSGIKPYKHDAFMPPYGAVVPHIYITPDNFSYYNTSGNSDSWNGYGKWQWGLMEGRDILPQELKDIVHNLTDTIPARRDKIKALYKYLGENTRYVSIQIGLGGLQPMSAEEVYKYGFGDCKALSNYMKAMLSECGIESNYVEINTENPTIFPDHASVHQTNHAILKVPDSHWDLWLECTNTDMPLGFLHNGIAGHDAVVYSNGSASIETLPVYPDSINRINTFVHIGITEDGTSSISVKEEYSNRCSESMLEISSLGRDKQTDMIKAQIAAPSCTVSDMKIKENDGINPSVQLSCSATSSDFISRSGQRMFIPLSVYKVKKTKFNKERELDIYIEDGYTWKQTIRIDIPAGYTVEGIPQDTVFSCCIGNITYCATVSGNCIDISIEGKYSSGRYSRTNAEEIRKFFSFIEKIYNQKIIICKK